MKPFRLPDSLKSGVLIFSVSILLMQCKENKNGEEGMGVTGDPTIDGLTEAIRATPNDPELYLQRSQIFYEREAYDQAVQDLASVMKLD